MLLDLVDAGAADAADADTYAAALVGTGPAMLPLLTGYMTALLP